MKRGSAAAFAQPAPRSPNGARREPGGLLPRRADGPERLPSAGRLHGPVATCTAHRFGLTFTGRPLAAALEKESASLFCKTAVVSLLPEQCAGLEAWEALPNRLERGLPHPSRHIKFVHSTHPLRSQRELHAGFTSHQQDQHSAHQVRLSFTRRPLTTASGISSASSTWAVQLPAWNEGLLLKTTAVPGPEESKHLSSAQPHQRNRPPPATTNSCRSTSHLSLREFNSSRS